MSLPFDLSAGAALYMAVALLVAAFVRGYSGFGFAALVVSAASLVMNPLLVVPMVLLVDAAMSLQQARGIWRDIAWSRVWGLFVGALIGVPVGIWAMTAVGVDAARAMISVYVLAMCGLLMAGFHFAKPVGHLPHLGVGVVSGVANAAAVGGLPVAVFFAAQPVRAAVFRGTLIAYFTLLDLWSIPLMARAGMISRETLLAAVLVLPILIFGIWAGGRHFLRAEPQNFRKMTIWLLVVLAGLGLLKSVV